MEVFISVMFLIYISTPQGAVSALLSADNGRVSPSLRK